MQAAKRSWVMKSALALVASLAAAGCSQTAAPPTAEGSSANAEPSAAVELTVSVAASVQDAMKEVQAAYQDEAPEVSITYNFGSSGSLAQQIAQGAPSDIFLSASKKWMDDLETDGQILPDSRQDLLLNALVAIAPREQNELQTLEDLATDKAAKVAIGEPDSVPAGRYAKDALTSLNLFETLTPKMVFAKDVRQVLAYVETGNVDAGLVYATDAKISDRVRVIATAAPETHAPIVYPVGIVADSDNVAAARDFVDFLNSETASAIFTEYGFTIAD